MGGWTRGLPCAEQLVLCRPLPKWECRSSVTFWIAADLSIDQRGHCALDVLDGQYPLLLLLAHPVSTHAQHDIRGTRPLLAAFRLQRGRIGLDPGIAGKLPAPVTERRFSRAKRPAAPVLAGPPRPGPTGPRASNLDFVGPGARWLDAGIPPANCGHLLVAVTVTRSMRWPRSYSCQPATWPARRRFSPSSRPISLWPPSRSSTLWPSRSPMLP